MAWGKDGSDGPERRPQVAVLAFGATVALAGCTTHVSEPSYSHALEKVPAATAAGALPAPESYDSQTPQPTNDVDNAIAHMRDIGTYDHQLYISTVVTQFEACTANGPGACGPLDASPALGFARQYASGDLNKKQGGIHT